MTRPGSNRVLVGTDLVATERVDRLLADDPALQERIFTRRELAYCAGKKRASEHLAARIAAKEAMLKAVGTGVATGIEWTDVEVVNNRHGAPALRLHGGARAVAAENGVSEISLSLSHTGGMAIAVVALTCASNNSQER